jgi:DNA-binding NarL/FixJ family response regulator
MIDGVEAAVHESSAEVAGVDLAIWRFDAEARQSDLAELANQVATLVIADESELIPAVDAGARGFLPNDTPLDEIKEAVMTMLEGGSVIPPDQLGTLLRHVVERRRIDRPVPDGLSNLTNRERDIYDLAVKGLRKAKIAEKLYISPGTARTHLQRVYKKLGVHSQAELIASHTGSVLGTSEEAER